MTNNLKSGERLDDLQLNGLQIIQDPERFCFGIDAVMLSDFARVKPGEKVLDLGTGTGILPILLSAKTRGEHFIGLEIQKESADMARRSIEWNHLQEKIEIVQGDIKEAAALFKPTFFDVIVTNPPYLRESKQLLADGKGRFYMIHKPFRLAEILTKMSEYKIEPKRIRFVHPYIDKEPTMVLIEGLRGGKPRVTIEPPIIMYTR